MTNTKRNPERPKLKGAYHPDSAKHAERAQENRADIGGTVYLSSGAMPPAYRGHE